MTEAAPARRLPGLLYLIGGAPLVLFLAVAALIAFTPFGDRYLDPRPLSLSEAAFSASIGTIFQLVEAGKDVDAPGVIQGDGVVYTREIHATPLEAAILGGDMAAFMLLVSHWNAPADDRVREVVCYADAAHRTDFSTYLRQQFATADFTIPCAPVTLP